MVAGWFTYVCLAFVGAALTSFALLVVRLQRLGRWRLSVTPVLRQKRRALANLMFAEGCYASIAAAVMIGVGTSRPIDTTRPPNEQSMAVWLLFGMAMNLIGSPLLSGAAERVLSSLEDETDSRRLSTASKSVMEIISIRKSAKDEIENSYYELNHEILKATRQSWTEPLLWGVREGWLHLEDIESSYREYLAFRDMECPDFVVTLRDGAAGGEDSEQLALILIEFIWEQNHSPALLQKSIDFRYLMATSDGGSDEDHPY